MSSDDFELDFDFGAWCPVCDKAIPSGPSPAEASGSGPSSNGVGGGQPSPSLPSSAPRQHKSKHAAPAHKPSLGPHKRTKSSTKVHHASRHHHGHGHGHGHGHHGHGRNASHTALAALSSLPHPGTTSSDSETSLDPPTGLYCSEECRRIDEARSRLALADLGPGAQPSNNLSRARTDSSVSLNSSHSQSHQNLPSPSLATLSFSARRNSRGTTGVTEGGYSFRPSLMQRVSSEEGYSHHGLPPNASALWGRSRPSTDSLASAGESDERSNLGTGRSNSALSGLRRMTPISPSFPASPPLVSSHLARHSHSNPSLPQSSQPRRRPPALSRHNTDAPRSTRNDAQDVSSPPPPSPGMKYGSGESYSQPKRAHFSDLASSPSSPPVPSRSGTIRPARTSSHASLALLGASFAPRSIDRTRAGGWSLPHRSESTASLSGFLARGEILPVSESTTPSATPIAAPTALATNGHGGRRSRTAHSVGSHSSHASSVSSFAHSHSSALSSQRSTAASSEHPPHKEGNGGSSASLVRFDSRSPTNEFSSSSAGSGHRNSASRPKTTKRKSTAKGLMMTPSTSSLSGAGSSYGDSAGEGGLQAVIEGRRSRKNSGGSERTPTQSLSKATGISSSVTGDRTPIPTAAQLPNQRSPSTERPRHRSIIRGPVPPNSMKRGSSSTSRPRQADGSYFPPNAVAAIAMSSAAQQNGSLASPGKMMAPTRNWSWDHLPVPQYAAMDVEKVRRQSSDRLNALGGGGGGLGPMTSTVSQVSSGAGKERKRLFFFDAGE